jgi:hypothetical protein
MVFGYLKQKQLFVHVGYLKHKQLFVFVWQESTILQLPAPRVMRKKAFPRKKPFFDDEDRVLLRTRVTVSLFQNPLQDEIDRCPSTIDTKGKLTADLTCGLLSQLELVPSSELPRSSSLNTNDQVCFCI